MYKLFFSLFLLPFLFLSCTGKENKKVPQQDFTKVLPSIPSVEIPNKSVDLSELTFDNKTSIWTLGKEHYSGYALSEYENGNLKEKFGFKDGRKQNECIHYFPDGHYKRYANYHKGKLHGEKKKWSPGANHILRSHLNYFLGKGHGIQKSWYATGELYKVVNLNMGKEEGIQQAFRKNGALYANYESKNGRIFGLKKSALCFGLEDEEVKYND